MEIGQLCQALHRLQWRRRRRYAALERRTHVVPALTCSPIGNTGGSVRVTPCQDGSYCCGVGTSANNCCAKGQGVFLAKDGQTTNVNPSSTSSSSAVTSSTISTTQITSSASPSGAVAATSRTATGASAAAVTKTTEKSTNNTGAIAGGVVGGLVAAALIIVAGLWSLRRRGGKELGDEGPWIPYATGSKPGYVSEVEGADVRPELPAQVGHEMPTEDSRMKKYQQVHELH
ncbi:MAG: hypothetical protein Q9213_000489 [Squamulea squamosa]